MEDEITTRLRWIALGAAFAAALGLVSWGLLSAAEHAELPYGTVPLDLIPQLDERLPPMRARRASEPRVLFLGDSLAIDAKGPDTSIPVRLGQKLAEVQPSGHAVELVAYTGPGLGLFSHYFLSQRVIDREPDQIVLAVNLRSFSKRWRADERPQLAGWLPAEGWPEALALPLHAVDVSADRLFFYRALVALGAFDAWHWLQREQVRLAHAYGSAARWLQAAARVENGLAFRMLHKQAELRRDKTSAFRATPYAARTLLGPALRGLAPDDPALEVLDALLRRFEAAGIAVLVYVAPINVEHLASIGAYDAQGMARTSARIETVSQRRGAAFLDLHDLLPDAAFADHLDHLVQDVEPEGSRALADRLAPLVAERLQNAPAAKTL
jgi:hypothetical protein